MMTRKLYVQAWTAPVCGAIAIDEQELRKIEPFKNLKAMIPMMTKINDEYKLVETHLTKDPTISLNKLEQLYESLEPWKD